MLRALRTWLRRRHMKLLKPMGRRGEALSLSLCDREPETALALADAFRDVDAVEVLEGDLLALDADAVVSPANSFGDMGGGIDKAIDDFHGGAAQRAVMAAIAERFYGELPLGMALVVELQARRFPWVVAAPTMRTPGNVARTINAYLAMRAALVAALRHNEAGGRAIRTLAVPGLCTGVGGMPAAEAAGQMRSAYDNVAGGLWRRVVHPALAPYALREGGHV